MEYMVIKREYVVVFMALLVVKFLILPFLFHSLILPLLGNSYVLCSGWTEEVDSHKIAWSLYEIHNGLTISIWFSFH